jgi:hypothetical protein
MFRISITKHALKMNSYCGFRSIALEVGDLCRPNRADRYINVLIYPARAPYDLCTYR